MRKSSIGVGIVGVSMERGWAKTAHIPALHALDEYEIRGVSARRQETADRSARELGLDLAFIDHRQLIERPEIDLVVITVKVPDHYAVVKDTLAAGKMIYCEWPLGRSLEESAQLASLAETQRVSTVVGLQGGRSPAVRFARELLDDGAIGKPLGTNFRVHIPGELWTGQLTHWQDYTKDRRNGANFLTIGVGHTLEPLARVLGEFVSLSAISVRQRPNKISVAGVPAVTDAPDEIIVAGTLNSSVVASVHYSAGASTAGNNVVWEITGEKGQLVLSVEDGYFHLEEVTVTLARPGSAPRVLPIPERLTAGAPGLSGPPANVARLYRQFARQRIDEGPEVPDFGTAVRRYQVLDAIEKSAESGMRQTLPPVDG
jgi:predicted dehydrogenase